MGIKFVKTEGIQLDETSDAKMFNNNGQKRLQLIQGPEGDQSTISLGLDAFLALRDFIDEQVIRDHIDLGYVETSSDLILIVDPCKLCEQPLTDKEHASISQVIGDMKVRDGMVLKMKHKGKHRLVAYTDDGNIMMIAVKFKAKNLYKPEDNKSQGGSDGSDRSS